jgi:prolyl 4-hydroxylase
MSTTDTKQQVTPDLRKWIVEQAEAGHSAESVLKAMLASGWSEDVAVEAMESTLRGHLEGQAVEQGLPPAVPVPGPNLDESPLYLDGGDRRVCVLQSM